MYTPLHPGPAHQDRIMPPFKLTLLAHLVSFAALSSQALAQVDFRGFGILPDASTSVAADVSADGRTVIGNMFTPTPQESWVIRWTFESGPERLVEPPEFRSPIATAVSGDGSIIVGNTARPPTPIVGFRWTAATGYVEQTSLEPSAISDDGAYEVGRSLIVGAPYRRSQATGDYQLLGNSGTAAGVSSDGSIVVGNQSSLIPRGAWRWTEETSQMEGLGALPDNFATSIPQDVTPDGEVIVGGLQGGALNAAFRWTETGGYDLLASLAGSEGAFALGVAADGRTIIGHSIFSDATCATIWLPDGSVHEMEDYLASLGAELSGWVLSSATGISDDGLTIAGNGVNPDGIQEGWVVRIPSPGSGVLLCLLALRSRRRSV